MKRTYQNQILNGVKLHRLLAIEFPSFSHIGISPDYVDVFFSQELTQQNKTDLDSFMAQFLDFTTAELMESYMRDDIDPFISGLMDKLRGENIAMGITQAGKTGHFLGLFEKPYDIYSNGFPISLKASFDTGSLYEALTILSFFLSNPSEYSGLSPFMTETRIYSIINEIVEYIS